MRSYWNLRLSSFKGALIFLLLAQPLCAQFSKPEREAGGSQEKYLFPIKPGQPASLAGTMGELRSTHFHSGIDIRTNNEIGWPVLAAKSGYVSRISMSRSGYGNVMYVKHPDGNTTLYGHLDKFNEPLASYVLNERYRRRDSEIDLYFRDSQFTVKQGDTIAFAGNTGSSGGPHLHFDIRDPNFDALDPLKFGFTEVRDNTPPVAQKIALKTLDINSRINDQFGRFEFYVAKSGNDYSFPAPILASGRIGVDVLAFDRVDTYRFRTGINFIEVYVDGKMTFCQTIERIDISETRNIYNLMDYKALRNSGARFYKLYLEDGSKQKFYYNSPSDGVITINPTATSNIKIILKDIEGNSTSVSFTVQPSPKATEIISFESTKSPLEYDFIENTLSVTTLPCANNIATTYSKGVSKEVQPTYTSSKKVVYLIDLKKQLPDSIVSCNRSFVTNIQAVIPSTTEYKYYSDWTDIRFPNQSLYDTLYFQANHYFREKDSLEVFRIGTPDVALHRNIHITLKPSIVYSTNKDVSVYKISGSGYSYAGGTWTNGKMVFATREFGEYTILRDSIPPIISRVYVNNLTAKFRIKDNLSGISNWEANINGQWLLMTLDSKTGILTSERRTNEPLKGNFELIVTDNAGNKQTYKQTIP